jgi:CDP-diglyceride synthetase
MLIPPIHAAPASAGAHMHPLLVLKILALVTVANGTPVVAKTILGDRFVAPIDGGSKFVDGRPLLGSSKTIRGIFLSILVTSVFAPVVGLDWKIGVLVASVAMAGDLFSSFLKRRMNLPAGGKATGLGSASGVSVSASRLPEPALVNGRRYYCGSCHLSCRRATSFSPAIPLSSP